MGLISQIRRTFVKAGDPRREVRIDQYALHVEQALRTQRDKFDLDEVLGAIGCRQNEIPVIISRVYERAVEMTWADLEVTTTERIALEWIGAALRMQSPQRFDIEQRIGLQAFERFLAKAFEDGILDDAEVVQLNTIANGLGAPISKLVHWYFSAQGEAFLRGIFYEHCRAGTLTAENWGNVVNAADSLGIPRDDFYTIVAPRARQMIEHVLADAKADDRMDDSERQSLDWCLSNLPTTPELYDYVNAEIAHLQVLTDIIEGQLPTEVLTQLELRAGELCHYDGQCLFQRKRLLKRGPVVDDLHGVATITDDRLAFTSEYQSFNLGHRTVLRMRDIHHGLHIQAGDQGKTGSYYFADDFKIATTIYRAAVGRTNQTITAKAEGAPSRHIPRDVRQRVWQRCAGRCVECGSNQYLEFDHIVPVAKGGSNADPNIQLLCRNCNLEKSDNI